MMRRILVGLDFRQPSLAAARWAATHLGDAALELVHVLHRPELPPFLRGIADPVERGMPMSEENARRALRGVAETLPARWVSVCTVDGPPHEALANRALETDADLVVLGRDVLDGARGRTLERVARRVEVPLLVVGNSTSARPERVIAAVDASPLRTGIVRCADRLCKTFNAELTLLHVLPEGLGQQVHRLTHAWLHGLHRAGGSEKVRLRTTVTEGAPGPCIVAEAKAGKTLIVVGRNGADSSGGLGLGAATRLVLRAAPGPVLVVPTADAWRPSPSLLEAEMARLREAVPSGAA